VLEPPPSQSASTSAGSSKDKQAAQSQKLALAMLENAPINVIMANRDLIITYINPVSVETLTKLQEYLPMAADLLVGQSIDIFHKNPAHQRRMLMDPRNLPHRAKIKLGPEILDLLVSPIHDANHQYVGPMLTWSVITQQEHLAAEAARMQSMMENSPINVMYADRDLVIRYMNPASTRQLRELQQHLPVQVDAMIGQNIDVFHKKPAHQRAILSDAKNLPRRATIQVGPEFLDLLVSPINDSQGAYIGTMVTWEVITKKLEAERRMKAEADAKAAAERKAREEAEKKAEAETPALLQAAGRTSL
jgi:methyl-accepting chemotaxis protein